jgi:hypothetical protein
MVITTRRKLPTIGKTRWRIWTWSQIEFMYSLYIEWRGVTAAPFVIFAYPIAAGGPAGPKG